MKKIIKKGAVILTIYLIAVGSTLLISNRIQELDTTNKAQISNQSLSINLGR